MPLKTRLALPSPQPLILSRKAVLVGGLRVVGESRNDLLRGRPHEQAVHPDARLGRHERGRVGRRISLRQLSAGLLGRRRLLAGSPSRRDERVGLELGQRGRLGRLCSNRYLHLGL